MTLKWIFKYKLTIYRKLKHWFDSNRPTKKKAEQNSLGSKQIDINFGEWKRVKNFKSFNLSDVYHAQVHSSFWRSSSLSGGEGIRPI